MTGRRRRNDWWQSVAAASLVVVISFSYLAAIVGFVSTAYMKAGDTDLAVAVQTGPISFDAIHTEEGPLMTAERYQEFVEAG